jgi:DNA-binding NtrC family response regulator
VITAKWRCLKTLQKQGAANPVIVMSSGSSHERLDEAIRKGARDFILNPVDTELLLEKRLLHFGLPSV